MKSWLENNDIELYSAHNTGRSAIAERFIRTLKNKIYKYISKNVYIDTWMIINTIIHIIAQLK